MLLPRPDRYRGAIKRRAREINCPHRPSDRLAPVSCCGALQCLGVGRGPSPRAEAHMIRCSPNTVRFVCSGLDHPEGLCIDSGGALYAGGEAGQIYSVDERTGEARVAARTGGFVLGMCADASGAIYVCDAGRNEVLRIDSAGEVVAVSTGTLDNPNDCVLDAQGNLFFSESGKYDPNRPSGRLHVVTRSGETRCIHPGPFLFANGLFLDSQASLLYLVESTGPSILAFRTNGPNLAGRDPVKRLELAPDTVPDGVAIDAAGNIYVAYYSPDQISMVRPDGRQEVLYRDFFSEWMNRPTNVVLRSGEILFANLGGWHLGSVPHELEPMQPCFPDSGPLP